MEARALKQFLQQTVENRNFDWKGQLEPRKQEELAFHDRHRNRDESGKLSSADFEELYGNKKFYKTARRSSQYVQNWIKSNAVNAIFLYYACGDGFNAIRAAEAGASLAIGIDLSNISIENARNLALEKSQQHNTLFFQADCEKTGLPDECIDTCICSGMLHHLDLSFAFFELRRILKPGGRILGVEALGYNPLIKLYREITPKMRTSYEKDHILSYADLKFAARFFSVLNIRHWHLFSLWGVYFPRRLGLLETLDDILLRIPGIRSMSWMITFELVKE